MYSGMQEMELKKTTARGREGRRPRGRGGSD
jgi:hypothetical protein